MKIRMLTPSAGPNGVLDADAVVEVPDDKALELIETHHAVKAGPEDKARHRWPHGVELSASPRKPVK